MGPSELLTAVIRRKQQWYGCVSKCTKWLAKLILEGTLKAMKRPTKEDMNRQLWGIYRQTLSLNVGCGSWSREKEQAGFQLPYGLQVQKAFARDNGQIGWDRIEANWNYVERLWDFFIFLFWCVKSFVRKWKWSFSERCKWKQYKKEKRRMQQCFVKWCSEFCSVMNLYVHRQQMNRVQYALFLLWFSKQWAWVLKL